jgi:hypothetical protein
MKFELTLKFETARIRTAGVPPMSDWSRKAAEQFQKNKDDKLVQDKKSIQDEETRKRLAPEMWQRLRQLFESKCTELNAERGMANTLSFDGSNLEAITVTRNGTKNTLKVTFDSTNQAIDFKSSTWKPSQYRLRMTLTQGPSLVLADEKGMQSDLESFVTDHIDSLLQVR